MDETDTDDRSRDKAALVPSAAFHRSTPDVGEIEVDRALGLTIRSSRRVDLGNDGGHGRAVEEKASAQKILA